MSKSKFQISNKIKNIKNKTLNIYKNATAPAKKLQERANGRWPRWGLYVEVDVRRVNPFGTMNPVAIVWANICVLVDEAGQGRGS